MTTSLQAFIPTSNMESEFIWRGRSDGQMLSLTEKNNQFRDKAYIKAADDDNQIRGTWKNKTQTLKFTLKRK